MQLPGRSTPDAPILHLLRFRLELARYMNIQEQIEQYISSQPEPKRSEMQELHLLIRQVQPGCTLWFEDGKNSENKIISNPNIGYGSYTIKYANGTTRSC